MATFAWLPYKPVAGSLALSALSLYILLGEESGGWNGKARVRHRADEKLTRLMKRSPPCHPERIEGSAFAVKNRRSRLLAALGMTGGEPSGLDSLWIRDSF